METGAGAPGSAIVTPREAVARGEGGGETTGPILATALNNLGYYLRRTGDYAGAARTYRRALEEYGRWVRPTARMTVLRNLAAVQTLQGDTLATQETLRERLRFARQAWPRGNWRVGEAASILAGVYIQAGELAEAEGPLREALAVYRETIGERHAWTGNVESILGAVLAGLGRREEAEGHLLRGYEILRDAAGPDDPRTRNAASRLESFRQARRAGGGAG